MLKALGLAHFVDWVYAIIPKELAADDYEMLKRAPAEIVPDRAAYGTPTHPIARLSILVIRWLLREQK